MTSPVGCRCVNLSLRFSKFGPTSRIPYRYVATSLHPRADDQIVIPKKIKRSDTAILEELAKTVKQESGPHYKYHDDPYLLPYGINKMTSHSFAKISGQKAAQYVIKTYPHLFNFNPVDPMGEFPSGFKNVKLVKEASLAKLKQRIVLRKPILAYNLYKSLKEKGTTIPQDVSEDLLGLLCVTNCETTEEKNEQLLFQNISERSHIKMTKRQSPPPTWRDDGEAELLFQDLEKPSPEAYNYLVRGRAIYGQKKSATELFQKMRSQGIPVSLETYNVVIRCADRSSNLKFKELRDLLRYMKEDGVVPNVHTFNSVLNSSTGWDEYTRPVQLKKFVNEVLNEMKALKIAPTLSTWLHVLIVYYPGRYVSSNVLPHILSELENKDFTLSDDLDYEFFSVAMEVCLLKQDINLANRLDKILNHGSNIKLLGRKVCEMKYQLNYISLMSMFESVDRLIEYYETTSLMIYPGSIQTFTDILKAVELNDGHRYIPQLYQMLVQMELGRKRTFLEPILDIMSKKQEEPLQSKYIEIANKIKTSIDGSTDERGIIKSLAYTGSMLGNLSQIFLNSNQFDPAWECFKLFKRNRIKVEGYPTETSLVKLVEKCIDEKRNENVLESLTVMADGAYPKFDQLQARALKELDLTDSERRKLEDLD